MNQTYLDTARLLTQIAPTVFAGDVFALKGGTAINLFVRDMPRLSVDLDLVFVDHKLDRASALDRINTAIKAAGEQLTKRGFQIHMPTNNEAGETKIFVRREKIEVKVEVNYVARGTVHPVHRGSLSARAKDVLQADVELPLVSLEDLYGGKLVAAMDRQHPRDLFDVMELLKNEGITPAIRRCFVVYLASHHRPIHEVFFPPLRDISGEYENSFKGMTHEPVELKDLLSARERMIDDLHAHLDSQERAFLVSLSRSSPDWNSLGIRHLAELPAIRWKADNIAKLAKANPTKLGEQANALEKMLS
jgi:predicted nucleotidyltransferase component of viral defense system